jgi:hypothetical protein
MAKRYTTSFLHTKALLNSKPNTRSAAGRYARSSMTNNVLQSKEMETTFGADKEHTRGWEASMLFDNLLEKPQFAATTKNMIGLCKHVHLVYVHFKNQVHTFWVRNRLCIRAYHTGMYVLRNVFLHQQVCDNARCRIVSKPAQIMLVLNSRLCA